MNVLLKGSLGNGISMKTLFESFIFKTVAAERKRL